MSEKPLKAERDSVFKAAAHLERQQEFLRALGFRRPTYKGFNEASLEKLSGIWRTNHAKLLEYIAGHRVPFFALHGTSKNNCRSILMNSNAALAVGTFEDTLEPEQFLYQLYTMAAYCSHYTGKENKGAGGVVMAFDTEHHGMNLASDTQRLHIISISHGSTEFDSSEDEKMLDWASSPQNAPRHGMVFSQRDGIAGIFDFSVSPLRRTYYEPLRLPQDKQLEIWARTVYRERICAQEIVARALGVLQ